MSSHVPPLEAIGVFARYGSTPVLQDISLRFEKGAVTAVLGPNGAGKSTLCKLLTGLLPPSEGIVHLFGENLRAVQPRDIARHIAVVPQQVLVAFDFSVREVVMMGRAPRQGALLLPSAQDQSVVDQVLERTDLCALADRNVRALSGGEQMRVAIARALAQQPEILILDEATAHLDIRHSVVLHNLVRREVQERGLVCVAILHDLNEAAQNADRVVLLDRGRVVAQGTVEQVMTYQTLRQVFGVDLWVGVNEVDNTRYFVPMRQLRNASIPPPGSST